MLKYGAHLSRRTIQQGVKQTTVEAAQVFLGSPRAWRPPAKLSEEELEFWSTYQLPVYVHASYLVNPASNDKLTRDNSIRNLQTQFQAASEIKARGVVVHGGHAPGETLKTAANRWREALKQIDTRNVPLLIENTAGGTNAPGRTVQGLETLWEHISDFNPQLCFDTCHAWVSGMLDSKLAPEEAFITAIDQLSASGITIALTHLNGSLDQQNSERDHHSNLSNSLYSLDVARAVAQHINRPAILETPGPLATLKQELDLLRHPEN